MPRLLSSAPLLSCYGGLGRSGLSEKNVSNLSLFCPPHAPVFPALGSYFSFFRLSHSRRLPAAAALSLHDGQPGHRDPAGAPRGRSYPNREGFEQFCSRSDSWSRTEEDPCPSLWGETTSLPSSTAIQLPPRVPGEVRSLSGEQDGRKRALSVAVISPSTYFLKMLCFEQFKIVVVHKQNALAGDCTLNESCNAVL